MALQRW